MTKIVFLMLQNDTVTFRSDSNRDVTCSLRDFIPVCTGASFKFNSQVMLFAGLLDRTVGLLPKNSRKMTKVSIDELFEKPLELSLSEDGVNCLRDIST